MNVLQELLDKIWNYPKCLAKGNQAFAGQQLEKAQKSYQKVIDHLAKRASLDSTRKQYLGEAYLGLGNICSARKENLPAVDYFIKALDNSVAVFNLPDNAIVLLGTTSCDKKDQSERAIEIFLRYIKLKPQDSIASKVYAILESLCVVDEKQNPDARKKAMSLNQRVKSVNQNIDWTYYYLGVGAYNENDKTNAQKHLLNAVKLNVKRALSYYWLGKIFSDLNQIESAEKHFLKFIDLIPNDNEPLKQAEAFHHLGTALIQCIGGFSGDLDLSIKANREKLEKAAEYFHQASSKNDQDDNILFNLARSLSLLNIHEPAISAYKKAIGINSKNGAYYYLLAVELKKLQCYHDAIKNVGSAVSIDDQDKYHQLLAELYLLTGNYSASENECLKIYGKNNVHDTEVFCLLTYVLYQQRKYAPIINICEKYPGKLTINKKYTDTYYHIARAYSNSDMFGKATEWYIKAVETKERADAVYYLGCTLANKGDYDKALTAFDRIIGKETEYQPLAYLQRGLIYSKLDQLKDAEDDFIKAYSLSPENINIVYSLGLFYYLAGHIEKALKYLSELLVIQSGHHAARFIRGHIYEKKRMIEAAIKEYESLPGDCIFALQSLLRLGILYFKQSDSKKAFKYLQQAYQSTNKSDALLFYYGLICAVNNNFVLALQSWNELLARYPDDERLKANIHRVHYLLGCSYIEENKLTEAIQEWKEYLKCYSEDIRTKKCLADLYFRLFATVIKTGDIQKAREVVLNAAELDEDAKKYIFYAALCDCKLGRFDECIKNLHKLMDSELGVPRIKYHQGVAFIKKGEMNQAMGIFNVLSNSDGNDNYVSYSKWLIANEYIVKGQYDKAIPVLEALRC